MAEVLDQSEVDALLAAVENGQVDTSAAADEPAAGAKPIADYDFQHPERVSKDQLRALEAIHESFARNMAASLSGLLRTIVELRVAAIEQLSYGEFIRSLPNPTSFNLLEADGMDGQLCLEISPLIIYPVIDRLLGGSSGEVFVPQRPLTVIESRLVQRIIDRALNHLSESWANLTANKFRLAGTESNPHLVQIVPPNEVVVVIVFEMKLGPRVGNMSLCIPFNVIEPILGRLASQSWYNYRRREVGPEESSRIRSHLSAAPVRMCAFLARTTITVGQLRGLRPGDVLGTGKGADGEIFLQVEGVNKYAGRVGQFRGKRAVRITRRLAPDDPV